MKIFEIFLFLVTIKKIYLITDYCSSRLSPKAPNDCVTLSTKDNKCCFNPNNITQCFLDSSGEEGLLCELDYFYGYMLGEENYNNYKDRYGFCTFVYGEIKGAFKYDIIIKDELNIEELETILRKSQNIEGPILIHVITKKGKGYIPAEKHPARFHGAEPFDIETGLPKNKKI